MTSLKKPNILYVMADQMTANLLHLYNENSPIKTPNLDRLAKDSVVFDSAYCNSPLCAPSRFSMVTGQLPHKIQGYDNASTLPSDVPTYAHYLRREGYRTALSGKMHFIGPDQLHGFEERLTSDIYPGDFGWTVNWDDPEVRADWYHNMSSVLDAGPVVRTNQLDYDDEVIHKSVQYLYDHVRHHNSQPFCLTVSMTHPHDPYAMTKDFWDLYEDVEIPLPKTPAIPHDNQDPHSQRVLKCIDLWGKEMPEERILAARRAYFAACSYVDSQIGRLLKTVDNCGLAEDTIIVFSGDHGDMLGERGLWYKMNWFENSARVPMLVHAPSRFQARQVKESVSTMDLLPTFVEMVGGAVDLDLPLDGVSLMPYIRDDQGPKPDTVLGEYMGEGTLAPIVMIRRERWKFIYSPLDPPQLFDLVADPDEAINLAEGYSGTLPEADSLTTQLTSKLAPPNPGDLLTPTLSQEDKAFSFPRATKKGLVPLTPPRTPNIPTSSLSLPAVVSSFLTEAKSRWDFHTITAQVLESQRRRRLVHGALTKGIQTIWDYNPPVDASKLYVRNMGRGAKGAGEALEDFELTSRWPRVR